MSRGVSQVGLSITFVIFLAADLGAIAGGWFSGRLIKKQVAPPAARLRVMLVMACLIPLSALVPLVDGLYVALALGMVIVFAHMTWLINLTSLVVDVIPQRSVATCFGVIAAGSAVGGMLMNAAWAGSSPISPTRPPSTSWPSLIRSRSSVIWRLRRMAAASA